MLRHRITPTVVSTQRRKQQKIEHAITPAWLDSRWTLAAILLLALSLRLLVWRGPLHQLANDEVEYVTVARDLLAGRGWVFYNHYPWLRAPLYNLFLAGSLWLGGGNLHRAALLNLALSVGNVWLIYQFSRPLFGRRQAQIAALLMAVLWTNVTFASLYMCETLFTFCFLAGMICLCRSADAKKAEHDQAFSRGEYWWPLLAGMFFGLATLTRSASLLFLPCVAVWLVLRTIRAQSSRFSLSACVPAVVFLVAAALTIAPWTVRNYVAYGRVIPVETGLAYNVWAFNEPREDLGVIGRTLSQISNPGERSDYAMAKGLERLREDPMIVIRKLWPNWVYLTRVKPIEDRFVLESYYLDVRLPQFAAALVLDDALYVVIVLAAMAGFVMASNTTNGMQIGSQWHAKTAQALATPKALCLLWLLYIIGTTLLTHGEGRYRHFVFPVLIPFAASALSEIAGQRSKGVKQKKLEVTPRLLGMLVALAFLIAFGFNYPYGWATRNTARAWDQALGDLAWLAGNKTAAVQFYQHASEARGSAHAYLQLGDMNRRAGDLRAAEAAYRESAERERLWVAPIASLGDLLRLEGKMDAAHAAYTTDDIDETSLLNWAWRHVVPPPRSDLDVGNGLDFGYVSGVYPAEQQQGASARWTNGHALVRLQSFERPSVLRLRLAAPHPGEQDATAEVCVASRCQRLDLARTWRTYTVVLPPNPTGMPIEIRSPTFNGGERKLGVLIHSMRIQPVELVP